METFICLNCFHSYRTKNKLKKHERVSHDHDCYVEMPNEDNKILKYYCGEKSLKVPAIIYADVECLLEKMHSCQNNLEKSYTEKKNKHTPSGDSLFTNCSFDETKNKLDCYKGEDCMERFCKDLREHAMKIINFEEKEMILLTSEGNQYYEMQKKELEIIVITLENLEELLTIFINIRYKTPNEIPVVFHNGSTHD